MKKLFNVVLCALCAAALFSCAKEIEQPKDIDEVVPEGSEKLILKAVSETTRTSVDGSGHTIWSASDAIKVICSDGTVSNFELVDGAGTTTADFSGYIPSGKTAVYAVYPADRYSSVSGTTVKVSIPASREGDFGSGNIAVAKVAGDHSLAFRNVNSFISFVLPTGTDVTSVVVESVDGSNLAGTLSVDCSGEYPAATTTIESVASSITTTTSSGAGTYYVAIAPGVAHAKGFKLSYKKGEDVTGVYYLNRNITTEVNTNYQMGEVDTKGNYYVTVSGAGSKSGLNWANAMSATQMWKKLHISGTDSETDDAKIAAIDGATFHLGAGTYNFGSTPTLSFDEASPITLTFKGGYTSDGASRNLASAPSSSTYRADFTGNSEHKCLILRGKIDATFEGIGFVNGYVDADNTAALDCDASVAGSDITLAMNYCLVDGNANGDSSADQWGGGAFLKKLTSFTADNVTFSNNTSYAVGALYIHTTPATLTNCIFSENVTSHQAGAVYINNSTGDDPVTFTSCTFSENEAESEWGGAIVCNGGPVNVVNCTFTDNTAVSDGGAISICRALITVQGGSFSGNSAGNGGAISCEYNDSDTGLRIEKYSGTGTTFIDNSATTAGGAIWGKTLSQSTGKNVHVADAVFKGNYAQKGGACFNCGDKSGMYFYDCTFGGDTDSERNYASNGASGYGGSICLVDESYCSATRTTFKREYASGQGGAVRMNNTGNFVLIESTIEACHSGGLGGAVYVGNTGTFTMNGGTINGCDALYGGAIATTEGSHGEISVNGSVLSNNHSQGGGAVSLKGTGTFRTEVYDGVGTTFQGNYADDPSVKYKGGAIMIDRDATVKIFRSSFIGNHAGAGGALYADDNDSKYADIFIDECSFDGNYISKNWGPVLSLDGFRYFCMNNCSIRNSYTTSTTASDRQDLKPSWICIDGIKDGGKVNLSNMSIIGNVQYSADGESFTPLTTNTALVAVWGTQTNYFTNCIIAPENSGIDSIRGEKGTEKIDLYYTHYNTVAAIGTNTNSGGNVSGVTSGDIDGLSWSNTGSISYYWKWDGTFNSSAPSMGNESGITSRMSTICSAFTDWIGGSDLVKDQRNAGRNSSAWWPGAYQNGAI